MPERLLQRPLWRGLLWLLPVGALATIAAIAFAMWSLVSGINNNNELTMQLRAQNARQNQTIRSLCDNRYLVEGGFAILEPLLETEQQRAALEVIRGALVRSNVEPNSLCVRP